jgi:hypothetical protein
MGHQSFSVFNTEPHFHKQFSEQEVSYASLSSGEGLPGISPGKLGKKTRSVAIVSFSVSSEKNLEGEELRVLPQRRPFPFLPSWQVPKNRAPGIAGALT